MTSLSLTITERSGFESRFGGVLLALTKKVRFGWFCFNSTLLAQHERCFETAAYERLNDSHIRDNKAMATRTAEQCSLDDLSLNSPWLSVCISIYRTMAEVDPETLLEWLNMGQGDERDMQLIALEQLCMLLLMADNVDRCFER
uniref:Uncharacterized protein n=1 Tax=Timema monikensis TaxID=170555 RepID=A0A7R9DZI6_9NEOP|nr:unnamed protein product [Timema monikensis]